MDRCPICDVAVKPENLLRHLSDIHPRHPDTAKWTEQLKAEPGRVAPRGPSRPLRLSRLQLLVILVVILLGVGGYLLYPYITRGTTPLPCISGNGEAYHWHTELTITSGGNPVTIPGDIGRSLTCMQILHTHDTSGLIHIEPDTPEQNRVYTIGEFFLVWGRPIDSPSRMLVNGTEVPASSSVGLYNGETISLEYASFTP
jgi:hypothetical protein